jgi:low temperature requirement protein LtrA
MKKSQIKINSIIATADKSADFVELFFDLIFVFAITKITHLTASHLDIKHMFQSIVIFWLIWWAWTQFTWTLNSANTNHSFIRLCTLIATAVAFIMATAVGRAFETGVLWFAVPYIVIKLMGLGLYLLVTTDEGGQRAAVILFASLSLTGLAAVLTGALVDPQLRVIWWLAAIVFDMIAGLIGAKAAGWTLNGKHFAERHGLIIIIALGESLIVAGSAISIDSISTDLIIAVGLAVVVTCLLWWSYFGWIREYLEENLNRKTGAEQAQFGRDIYSFLHYLLVCGIIGIAVGFEKILGHPSDALTIPVAVALGTGSILFVGFSAFAVWRAEGKLLIPRLIIIILSTVGIFLSIGQNPNFSLGILMLSLFLIVIVEKPKLKHVV